MRRKQSLLILLCVLCCPTFSRGQAWSGIIDPSRAIDWTSAGMVGGIPSATWTQCGSTIAAGASAASINTAIQNCGANQYVLLGAGTFNLTTGIQMKSNVVLRGSGANSTFLIFTGNNSCGGVFASICMSLDSTYTGSSSVQPGGTNAATWSGGYSQGATSITLTSVGSSGLSIGQFIYLDQLNLDSDPGTMFVCDNTSLPCSLEGGSPGRSSDTRNQIQIVKITGINGSTYGISPGLYGINWSSGQSPGAWWASTQLTNAGVENLYMDNQNNGGYSGIAFQNAFNCWVSGIASNWLCSGTCSSSAGRNHIWFVQAAHITIQNSYFYATLNATTESYGVESFVAGDNLVLNNIFQQVTAPLVMGPSLGSVFAYNFSIDDWADEPTYLSLADWEHDAGVLYNLWEGNIGAGQYADLFHGTGGLNTYFRNRWNGNECTGGTCNTGGNYPIRLDSYHRAENVIGNVLGTSGVQQSYQNGTSPPIYNIGNGNTEGSVTVPSDSLVISTLMRWGNYDTVNGSVQWNSSEVPSGISPYGNTVPSNYNLPASFFYSSTPSWWPSGKAWPPIGPGVANGNLGVCSGGTYNKNMATASSQCTGGSLVTAAGGYANSNPAMDCYLNTMGGPPDGTGNALTFNANTCYGQSAPAPPSGLTAVPH